MMDTIRLRDVGVGEKIKQERDGVGGVGGWSVNNSLTGGMKQPQRVFGAVWLEGCAVWCGVVQHNAWVIHHANTAGGHSLAQRYAEQGENNVLHLHPLHLIEAHSSGATFTQLLTFTLYKSIP